MNATPNQPQNRPKDCQQRILIVDDHPIFRKGIAMLLEHERDIIICGEAETAAQAMGLVDQQEFDLVIADISLKDINGI